VAQAVDSKKITRKSSSLRKSEIKIRVIPRIKKMTEQTVVK
jgi:hypothetical protein